MNKSKSKQVCTNCGGNHWSPDCPDTARIVKDRAFMLRNRIQQLLDYAKKLGFSLQLEIGIPASKRQAIREKDIYLKPLDGSDKLTCACCGNDYECRMDVFRGTLPNPLNWCLSCRERLRERAASVGAVLAEFEQSRKGKHKKIIASIKRIQKAIEYYKNQKPATHSVK